MAVGWLVFSFSLVLGVDGLGGLAGRWLARVFLPLCVWCGRFGGAAWLSVGWCFPSPLCLVCMVWVGWLAVGWLVFFLPFVFGVGNLLNVPGSFRDMTQNGWHERLDPQTGTRD